MKEHWMGGLDTPTLDVAHSRSALAAHMPELLPDYDALLGAMRNTPAAAQALAMYNLRPWWHGCSQAVTPRGTLLRNYDLGPGAFAGQIHQEPLAGGGWIIGTPEYGWGYLDGMNDRGLTASINST